VMIYMMFYYAGAGIYANIALLINLLFIFGILGAFKAVLTLPGIAGIVLTIAMSVDANVIVFERIKEELKLGKKLAQATADGFKNALSSIIDGNITIFLTAGILFFFGEGPVKGFATTLMIGILTSLFSAVLLSRYFMEKTIEKGGTITFSNSITKNWLSGLNIDFFAKKKLFYFISSVLTIISIVSLFTNKLNLGTDFKGGRSYVVRFEKPINPEQLGNELSNLFIDEKGNKEILQVKTFGEANQVKISTKYKIDDESAKVEGEITSKIFQASKKYLPKNLTQQDFQSPTDKAKLGIMSYIKVGPTVADDITIGAFIAVALSLLVVFMYLFYSFKKWQYSLGAVLAVTHDVIIVLGVFSLFYSILPFSLEIDQAFIAAILTVIGYSINDTVIVFDRIRENTTGVGISKNKNQSFKELVNYSINSTLGRTLNTSFLTLLVIIIIFFFGGENIRGFMFALLVGIGVGTYSSIFIASLFMYELVNKSDNKIKKS
ncbi:MAG: protein translocase subunit SecF, partial [Solirubrobacteraceae bacterium]